MLGGTRPTWCVASRGAWGKREARARDSERRGAVAPLFFEGEELFSPPPASREPAFAAPDAGSHGCKCQRTFWLSIVCDARSQCCLALRELQKEGEEKGFGRRLVGGCLFLTCRRQSVRGRGDGVVDVSCGIDTARACDGVRRQRGGAKERVDRQRGREGGSRSRSRDKKHPPLPRAVRPSLFSVRERDKMAKATFIADGITAHGRSKVRLQPDETDRRRGRSTGVVVWPLPLLRAPSLSPALPR